MRSRLEIQREYDALYKSKPKKWSSLDRSNFMIEALKKHTSNVNTVIDIGCGIGVALENYGRHNPGAKLYGTDFSKEAISLSQKLIPNGRFTTQDEFDDIKQFDLVMCLGVAEHVEDLPPFLISLKHKLTPNGFCYFEVPHNLEYSKGPETFRRLETRSRQWEWHYPREKWESLLLTAGFEIVEKCVGLNATWEFIWILK